MNTNPERLHQIIPQADIHIISALADLCFVGRLPNDRTLNWRRQHNQYSVRHVRASNRSEYIGNALIADRTKVTNSIIKTEYLLKCPRGDFTVKREQYADESAIPKPENPIELELVEICDRISYENGFLLPRPGDWDELVLLFAEAATYRKHLDDRGIT